MPVAPSSTVNADTCIVRWAGETGTGQAAYLPDYPVRTIQATGSGTVTVQGSRDGTNWAALKNTNGTPAAISLNAATNAADTIRENCAFIRVIVAGGTATVIIVASK